VKSPPRSTQFVGRDGTSRVLTHFHISGSVGPTVRVALWNSDASTQHIQINTKNYSSCLINTKLLGDIRFRLKYNEDVDLTLQILKMGYKNNWNEYFYL
jgi:hypothetical protein